MGARDDGSIPRSGSSTSAALFNLQRIRFFPREKFVNERFIQRFRVGTSDGDPLKDGTRDHAITHRGFFFDFDLAYDIKENSSGVMELAMPSEPVQRLLLDAPENSSGIWELAEFEIYGFGFANEATYRSNIIDLGEAVALGSVTWSGRQDPEAVVELRTRSGDSAEPNNYWRFTFRGDEKSLFDQQGKPLTRQSYAKLNKGEKAGITYDTRNWDSWSPAYDFSAGVGDIQANKPRRLRTVQRRLLLGPRPGQSTRLRAVCGIGPANCDPSPSGNHAGRGEGGASRRPLPMC